MTTTVQLPSNLTSVFDIAARLDASDIHLATGEPVYVRVAGQLKPLGGLATDNGLKGSALVFDPVAQQDVGDLCQLCLTGQQQETLNERGSADGAFTWNEIRFRFNVFRRNNELCFAIRRLASAIPKLDQLGIDNRLYNVCDMKDGLVLVAGPTGSGKSTTLASLLDRINQTRQCHIVTIEDPVEFLHPSATALVNQRQIGPDVGSFHQALLDAMRQDPDVILVGELRDLETVRTAITAAETGHLVFATVHAGDTKTAVERLISAYSADEQHLAQRLVATVLRTVVVQHLLPRQDSPDEAGQGRPPSRVLATERVYVNSGIANLIATGNLTQLVSIIQTSGEEGMWTLDESLAKLLRQGLISETTARSLARQPDMLGQLARRR